MALDGMAHSPSCIELSEMDLGNVFNVILSACEKVVSNLQAIEVDIKKL